MKKIVPVLLLLVSFISFNAYSQSTRAVSGSVQDTTGKPIQNVFVKLVSESENQVRTTDEKGIFSFSAVKSLKFNLVITLIGYETFSKEYTFDNARQPVVLEPIKLKEVVNQLDAVTIVGVVPVKVSEDTVEFSPPPTREGDAVEEAIKKIPGVEVDKDGNVTTDGKPITKITVNGKDFFGGDVATAIQSLPADVVQSLQIVDDYGEEAKQTGIKTDDPVKVLNIKIRPDRNKGYNAFGSLGKGNEDRYSGSLRGTTLRGERQVGFDGFAGNVTQRGPGGGGGNDNGLTNTQRASLTYSDKWSKKVSVYGSYGFNTRDNTTFGSSFSQNIFTTRTDNQTQNANNGNTSHNLSFNMDYRIDSLNFLKITPNVNINSSDNTNAGITNTSVTKATSLRDNRSSSTSSSPNMGINVNYNHRFHKKGRNFNLFANLNQSEQDQDRDTKNTYTNFDSLTTITTVTQQNQLIGTNNVNKRNGIRASYNEPITPTSFISLSYSLNHNHTDNLREVYDVNSSGQQIFNAGISNNYEYEFITSRIGLNYRVVKKNYNYTFGVAAAPVELKGHDISRSLYTNNKTFNWIPNARFVFKLHAKDPMLKQNLNINYMGRSNQPSFSQLQPITDNSNLQNTIVGNPNLNPEFINSVDLHFDQSNTKTGYLMNGNLQFSKTEDKIVTIRQYTGTTQQTTYSNTDGFYSVSGNYSFTKPFAKRKFTINYGGNANYSNNVSFISAVRNISKALDLSQNMSFRIFINDVMDTRFFGSARISNVKYSSSSSQDRNSQTYRYGIGGRNFIKNLTLGYDLSKVENHGLSGGLSKSPTLLGMSAEYKFLKGNMARVTLRGSDLLNQNTGISRSVSSDQIVDSQSNQLGRYFILSLSMQIRKFAGGVNPANRQGQPGQPGQRTGQPGQPGQRPGQPGQGGQRPGGQGGQGGQRPGGGGFGGGF